MTGDDASDWSAPAATSGGTPPTAASRRGVCRAAGAGRSDAQRDWRVGRRQGPARLSQNVPIVYGRPSDKCRAGNHVTVTCRAGCDAVLSNAGSPSSVPAIIEAELATPATCRPRERKASIDAPGACATSFAVFGFISHHSGVSSHYGRRLRMPHCRRRGRSAVGRHHLRRIASGADADGRHTVLSPSARGDTASPRHGLLHVQALIDHGSLRRRAPRPPVKSASCGFVPPHRRARPAR